MGQTGSLVMDRFRMARKDQVNTLKLEQSCGIFIFFQYRLK